jgi:hypothetical protein
MRRVRLAPVAPTALAVYRPRMRTILGLWVVAVLLTTAATAAHADDGEQGKLAIGGSLAAWIPQSDAEDLADVSLGIRPQVMYWVAPFVAVGGAFDFVFVNEDDGVGDATYFAISVGGRLTMPGQRRVKPYGEVMIGMHFIDVEGTDESDIGFRFGGGVSYALSTKLELTGGLAYSTASFDAGFVDFTVGAFILDVGIAARF